LLVAPHEANHSPVSQIASRRKLWKSVRTTSSEPATVLD
jgi:hypothetical protein